MAKLDLDNLCIWVGGVSVVTVWTVFVSDSKVVGIEVFEPLQEPLAVGLFSIPGCKDLVSCSGQRPG